MSSLPFFLVILCASFFPALSPYAADKAPIPLDKETVEKITAAHRLLEENVNNVSGRSYSWRVDGTCDGPSFSTDGLKEQTRAKFYRRGESIRLEMAHKDLEGNFVGIDEEEAMIFISTPSVSYTFWSTVSDPVCELREYATPSDTDHNVRPNTESLVWVPLVSLTHVMNKSVLEILQYPITQWETKPFHDISDALWITCDNPSAKTDLDFQQFQVVLSPSEDYAVLFYKVISKVEILQGEIRSMISDVYGRVPIMIDQRVQAPEGSSWGLNYREVTELDYSDNRSFSSTLFTADGFDEEHKGKIVIRDGKKIIVHP
ncbi:MAG: hypothetical protein J6S75_04275 [Thermoguttaceae bacterium]|nr:hypothetical protein [Thermoguttaceae bacterium]